MAYVEYEVSALAEFVRGFLSPASYRALNITTSEFDLVNFGILAEAIGWLSLGVDIGVFDRKDAGLLISTRVPNLSQRASKFSREWGFLFPPLHMLPVERAMRNEDPYSESRSRFEHSVALHSHFVIVSTLASRFALSESAKWLALALNFLKDSQWRRLSSRQTGPNQVAKAFRGLTSMVEEVQSHGWLHALNENKRREAERSAQVVKENSIASCIMALQHMFSFTSFFLPENRPSEVTRSDWAELRIRSAEIHGWCMNFRSGNAAVRFRELGGELARDLQLENGILDMSSFLSAMDSLMVGWDSLRVRVQSAR